MSEKQTASDSERRLPKLPKAVLPLQHESEVSPEQRVTEIVDRFERGWAKKFGTSRAERQWGDCNIAPDIFSFVAQDEGRRNNYDPQVHIYQLLDLHGAAGGSRREAFQHAFNTIKIGDEAFLADLSFSQFIGKDGYLSLGPHDPGYSSYSSGVPNNAPLAQELITKGFVHLTDENLQEYLRATTTADDRSYIKNMTAEALGGLRSLPLELFEADGIGPEFGRE